MAAVESIATMIGIVPQTTLTWVMRHEIDSGVREGPTTVPSNILKGFPTRALLI